MISPTFSHPIHCDDIIFTSALSAISPTRSIEAANDSITQSEIMMRHLDTLLDAIGANASDVLKLNVFYVGHDSAKQWKDVTKIRDTVFKDPGPTATGIPVDSFSLARQMIKIAATSNTWLK